MYKVYKKSTPKLCKLLSDGKLASFLVVALGNDAPNKKALTQISAFTFLAILLMLFTSPLMVR